MSSRVLSWLPHFALLLPILLMLCSEAYGQNTTETTSLLGAFLINKIERCIDKLNAIAELVSFAR